MPQRETGKPGYQEAHTLLIVDDDEINRGILDQIFASYYDVEEAENGKLGFKKSWITPKNTERCFWMWSCPR